MYTHIWYDTSQERKRRTYFRNLDNGTLNVLSVFSDLNIKAEDLPKELACFRGLLEGLKESGGDTEMAEEGKEEASRASGVRGSSGGQSQSVSSSSSSSSTTSSVNTDVAMQ